jgi:hypothetical protein
MFMPAGRAQEAHLHGGQEDDAEVHRVDAVAARSGSSSGTSTTMAA